MKHSQQTPIDLQAAREAWRMRELGCAGSPTVQAVMLYAVAKFIGRPVETMPRPEPDQLWQGFATAIRCKAVKLTDLPLTLLSPGERFALAVGTLFNSSQLPIGETFLELVDSASDCGVELAGRLVLSSTLAQPYVQAVIPTETLRFFDVEPAREFSDDVVMTIAREALDVARIRYQIGVESIR